MTASLTAALALKHDFGPGSTRVVSSFAHARISSASLIGVAFAHAGLLGLLLLTPDTPPVTPPRPLTVSLIEPWVEAPQPQPEPEPRLQPPKPVAKPLPKPVMAVTPPPLPQPAAESAEPTPLPEPAPQVLPPSPAPVAEAPRPATTPPRPADYLDNPKPPYPSLSKRLGEEGTVRLNILVNPDGSVARLELAKSSGHPRLDRSAIDTVQSSWKFEPARQGDTPVAAWVIVPIQFALRS